jgi:capsular polysaccharide biosynthesis protein
MSTDLERRQEGEQFRIVDPANLPEKPSFPRKEVFAGGGFVGGLSLGVGLALLLELSRQAIHNESDVEHYLKLPVIVSIPLISAAGENEEASGFAGKWRRRKQESSHAENEMFEAVGEER